MTRDIIEINDFLVIIEQSDDEKTIIDKCGFDEPVIGFSFYGSGNSRLSINHSEISYTYDHTKGFAMSFFANERVEFVHNISLQNPLQCVVIVISLKNLRKLPNQEDEVFSHNLDDLVHPHADFVEGPTFYMTYDMQAAVDKIFNTSYKGKTRMMFLRSQVTELLAHFLALQDSKKETTLKAHDRQKLYEAKEILENNMEAPPSLNELSKRIGLNSYKLKKNFKELFGVPVFKYLQNERLAKAYDLLKENDVSIQEAAWQVGYDSASSFSNAFFKKFGFRPSEVKK